MKEKYPKRCLPQEGQQGACVFHRDPSAAWELTSRTVDFRHIHKTYGLNMKCLENCSLNFHHQPPTNCFANTSVLQHVPVTDRGSWLRIPRTKLPPFTEISSARKPASSSPHVMKPCFLAHRFCTRCQSAQLCGTTYPPDGPSTSAPELLMCTKVSKNCFSSA